MCVLGSKHLKASTAHTAGGRLRSDMAAAGVRLRVGTAAARYGLGTRPGPLVALELKQKLKKEHNDEFRKPLGVIDEGMLITPRRMNVIAGIQLLVLA